MRCSTNKLLSEHGYKLQNLFFIVFAGVVVIASVLHFWPFEDSKIWQMLNIPNFCCGIGLALAAVLSIFKKGRDAVFPYMPHVSIVAYLAINVLSISIADSLSRPLNYTLKLALVFTGGLFLFQRALSKPKVLNLFYIFIALTASLAILVCIYTRLTCDPKQFGFHGNVFKYGTYIGILVPLAGIYLFCGSKLQVLLAILITVAGVFSTGSAGACLAIFAGLITTLVLSKKPPMRAGIIICLLLSAAALFLSNKVFDSAAGSDFALKENDGINLMQRYIEWQAEINLLEKRGITGTGAGCVNDYRSNFYYRLPKLNTLKAFDQNGFLATGAETGLLGLAAFIWILIHYGRMSFRDCMFLRTDEKCRSIQMAVANTAAFVSALTANLFSSVHYNGILIIFVLLLSLISSVNEIYGVNTGEN
ncbi:MAG: O-antigen ligase family protein [Planctomycetota bacterium]|jgi:hypothetical protein